MTRPETQTGKPRLFANPNFRWLLGGGLLSMLGEWAC